MKNKISFLAVFLLIFNLVFSQPTQDVVIPVKVEIIENPYAIKVSWVRNTADTKGYLLSKKSISENKWKTVKVLNNPISTFTDKDVVKGVAYEYRVSTDEAKLNSRVKLSYFVAGTEIPALYKSGGLLFVVDSTTNKKLTAELETYYDDLIADGWNLQKMVISEKIDHIELRSRIKEWYKNFKKEHRTVLLFGRIPVPYSGNFTNTYVPPDAHKPSHNGAWPADVYYAEVESEKWTDINVNNKDAGATRLHNIPGDKKFDQRLIPEPAVLNVGRIDMRDLPLMGDEFELLKRYILKQHKFRTAKIKVEARAVMQDRFNRLNGEYPAQLAFICANSLFTEAKVTKTKEWLKYVRDIKNNSLYSHIASGGSYYGMNAIARTEKLDTAFYTVFNSSFGSYFGDWDVKNSFLRAMIAAPGYSLTSYWNGRPTWMIHQLNMGKTIGWCTNLSQNNGVDFNHNAYYGGFRPGHTHIALMGDPSLKLNIVEPVKNMKLTTSADKKSVKISWDKSLAKDNVGYVVYACNKKHGNYIVLTNSAITNNEYTDNNPYNGDNYFMVRAVSLTKTPTTTYYNLSSGVNMLAKGLKGNFTIIDDAIATRVLAYPSPAKNTLYFKGIKQDVQVQLIDVQGKILIETVLNKFDKTINISTLTSGTYFVSINESGKIYQQKITVVN